MTKANEHLTKESKTGKAQANTWVFLLMFGLALFPAFANRMAWAVSPASASDLKVTEELNQEEKQNMAAQLVQEGDRYLKEKNYNLANASYESIFLLEPNNVQASQRIDQLKKAMAKEGVSETALVTRVYDQEIDERVREYLSQAKQLIAERKFGQARFALQKLLLINPLHQEAGKLYDQLNSESKEKA
ncbi:MAG: hypothetical protein A3C35_00385 [Omnitrophica bacterium RIFCSPHIGHO2_02_FULL_46_11]|nr:MAG: hypothetical protein A3A81_08195 [Omnitrophica bacterium RIFCSPLOWO2_01_FULL_45_10b]OGW87158.1 MAG: hypothetical protein A3C35_00385 [Omnitrophica bacterium RIFCSPHIGHO2_02_FULL_46_11]